LPINYLGNRTVEDGFDALDDIVVKPIA